jgi:DNA polymerase/3'-5' exonuclease PolX
MIVNNLNGNATSQYYRGSKEHNTAAMQALKQNLIQVDQAYFRIAY